MVKKGCERCKELIDLNKDLHVSLGTYDGKKVRQMIYFHFNCWRSHFEEKAREKAQNIVNHMQEKMMLIAKQLTKRLKNEIEARS